MPDERSLKYFDSDQLNAALVDATRIYMTGKLQREQESLEHFGDVEAEAGISSYGEYTSELPHFHASNTEFNFVLEGRMKVLLPESGEERELAAGSLFIIEPDMPYCTKLLPGTRVLFFKAPGGNDKQLVPITPSIERWQSDWDAGFDDGDEEEDPVRTGAPPPEAPVS